MCGIYLIKNNITNKVYIGQSIDIKRRWSEHKARAFNLENNCAHKPLYSSMRKYGLEAFSFKVICECMPEELNEKEKFYINFYNSLVPNGYNISLKEQLTQVKAKTCKKCGKIISSDSLSGLCRSCYSETTRLVKRPSQEELVQQLQEVNGNFEELGRRYGINGNSIRKWCKSYGISHYTKDYKVIIKNTKPHKIPVNQIDLVNNTIIATYESANAAARALGKTSCSHITEVCEGIHKTAYGYKWEYAALV